MSKFKKVFQIADQPAVGPTIAEINQLIASPLACFPFEVTVTFRSESLVTVRDVKEKVQAEESITTPNTTGLGAPGF